MKKKVYEFRYIWWAMQESTSSQLNTAKIFLLTKILHYQLLLNTQQDPWISSIPVYQLCVKNPHEEMDKMI